jgi:hypothetical protein
MRRDAAIVAAAVSLVALAALHILKPDLHPSRTMISQYALGPYGRVMAAVFRGVRRGQWKSGGGDRCHMCARSAAGSEWPCCSRRRWGW